MRVIDPKTNRPLSLQKVKEELSIFYIAGFETTSHAITWSLGLLASHPAVQDQLASELAAAGLVAAAEGELPREFEWTDLGRLPFLLAVIRESMRLFQPVSSAGLVLGWFG
jgi:cytochrome P450